MVGHEWVVIVSVIVSLLLFVASAMGLLMGCWSVTTILQVQSAIVLYRLPMSSIVESAMQELATERPLHMPGWICTYPTLPLGSALSGIAELI